MSVFGHVPLERMTVAAMYAQIIVADYRAELASL